MSVSLAMQPRPWETLSPSGLSYLTLHSSLKPMTGYQSPRIHSQSLSYLHNLPNTQGKKITHHQEEKGHNGAEQALSHSSDPGWIRSNRLPGTSTLPPAGKGDMSFLEAERPILTWRRRTVLYPKDVFPRARQRWRVHRPGKRGLTRLYPTGWRWKESERKFWGLLIKN